MALSCRTSTKEKIRTNDLLHLMPTSGEIALDIGARDGYFSLLLAQRFNKVIALDVTKPSISHPKITCIQGNAAHLGFSDNAIDFVFCAEVLEHIPQNILVKACHELERVCKRELLIGVPYRQDTRVGRTTCYSCGKKNPPWGHINKFDENSLPKLFKKCIVESTTFVGLTTDKTNALSAALMDLAGNPYGTYSQEEPCIYCGHSLLPPPARTFNQKVLTKLGFLAQQATLMYTKPRANWMHMLLSKNLSA